METPEAFAPWLAPGLAAALAGFLLSREVPLYWLSPDEWSVRKYGDDFVATKRTGIGLPSILEPGETFHTWGDETGLYFYSKQRPTQRPDP